MRVGRLERWGRRMSWVKMVVSRMTLCYSDELLIFSLSEVKSEWVSEWVGEVVKRMRQIIRVGDIAP